MALHPVIQAALSSAAGLPAYDALPIAEARAQAKLGYPNRKEPVPVGDVRNLNIAGPGGPLALRIYRPVAQGPCPIVVFFHGSGFVILDLDTHDDICRRLCAGASCVVVSVDYRLAPEHKFPAAPDDCLAATRWVAAHAGEFGGDVSRIVVAGDSAGGCLAAVTAQRIRDEGGPRLQGQLLWYPVTNYPTVIPDSYRTYGSGFGLTQAGIQWYWAQYLENPSVASHPHASPLRVASTAGLPSAYVLVAEFDVLRDEGEAFARRLVEGGVETVARRWAAMNHGFLKYTGVIDDADAAMVDACAWLTRTFRRNPELIEA